MVKTTMVVFPKAKIVNVRTSRVLEAEAALEALPEVDDDWDPFEES